MQHNRDGIKPYQFFLFEDVIVYAKPNVLNDKYNLNHEIPLTHCLIRFVPTSDDGACTMDKLDVLTLLYFKKWLCCDGKTRAHEPGKPSHSFVFMSRQKSFHVQGDNMEESNSWKESIDQAAR